MYSTLGITCHFVSVFVVPIVVVLHAQRALMKFAWPLGARQTLQGIMARCSRQDRRDESDSTAGTTLRALVCIVFKVEIG